jgi:hypothetical protein
VLLSGFEKTIEALPLLTLPCLISKRLLMPFLNTSPAALELTANRQQREKKQTSRFLFCKLITLIHYQPPKASASPNYRPG